MRKQLLTATTLLASCISLLAGDSAYQGNVYNAPSTGSNYGGAKSALTGAVGGVDNESLVESIEVEDRGIFDWIQFGSYGELHVRTGDVEEVDLHRAVLFTNIDFGSRVRFISELEFEHAFYDSPNNRQDLKIEVEQAYFQFDIADGWQLNAGVMLVPVGIINETHEPTTFFGTERNNVEKFIIPTTWWEGGISLTRKTENGYQFDLMLHTGFNDTSGSIRGGRPKLDFGQYTDVNSWAITARAKYVGIAGLELASSVHYQHDIDGREAGSQDAEMVTAHAIWQRGGFELRTLGSVWHVDGDPDADYQWGAYVEPSYSWETPIGKVGVFARYSYLDYFKSSQKRWHQYDAGIAYWPIDQIVVKADFSSIDKGSSTENTVNFGVGWAF